MNNNNMNSNNSSNKTTEAVQASVKPFCVKTGDFTKEQIIEIVDLMIDAGVGTWDLPVDYQGNEKHLSVSGFYPWDAYPYWGCRHEFGIYTCTDPQIYRYNILQSMQEVYQHLGIKQEKTNMKNNIIKQQQTKQIKSSNKGPKILPKTSNLLVFVYQESEYTVRGVTDYEIVHEAPSLFLKYDFHRANQSGHVQGSDKVKILGDLEKIVFKAPSDHNPNVYKQKIVLNLKG